MNKKYSKIILAVMWSCHQILKQPIGNWTLRKAENTCLGVHIFFIINEPCNLITNTVWLFMQE